MMLPGLVWAAFSRGEETQAKTVMRRCYVEFCW